MIRERIATSPCRIVRLLAMVACAAIGCGTGSVPAAGPASSLAAVSPQVALGVGDERFVEFAPTARAVQLAGSGGSAALVADSLDFPGVRRAVADLQADVFRVTGIRPPLVPDRSPKAADVVVVGTLGRNPLIGQLVDARKIDVSPIRGRWESSLIQVVCRPWPGVERALVIVGGDQRGTIFGVYTVSEQMGVSPWYWWADVPVRHRDSVFVRDGRYVRKEPAVRYRGLFINDEAPALSGWTREKFGGFNHQFYGRVFELLLRLKANFLWPAMWGNAFNDDDPINPALASEYGIVIGTSHHEPMMRAHDEWRRYGKGPWNYATNAEALRAFWTEGVRRTAPYENIITLAMRGDGDEPMSREANVALLERIVADQRRIIAEIVTRYTTYNGWRKPEMLEPRTYSLVDYREAETVVDDYRRLAQRAEALYAAMPADTKDAFYQLVLYTARPRPSYLGPPESARGTHPSHSP